MKIKQYNRYNKTIMLEDGSIIELYPKPDIGEEPKPKIEVPAEFCTNDKPIQHWSYVDGVFTFDLEGLIDARKQNMLRAEFDRLKYSLSKTDWMALRNIELGTRKYDLSERDTWRAQINALENDPNEFLASAEAEIRAKYEVKIDNELE